MFYLKIYYTHGPRYKGFGLRLGGDIDAAEMQIASGDPTRDYLCANLLTHIYWDYMSGNRTQTHPGIVCDISLHDYQEAGGELQLEEFSTRQISEALKVSAGIWNSLRDRL